jgi:hypothetical protein
LGGYSNPTGKAGFPLSQEANMRNNKETISWRSGYDFALILLIAFGVCLIVIGTLGFPGGSLWNVIFVNTGVAMAPAAIVAELFRFFLFKEIQYELTHPLLDEVRDRLGPQIRDEVNNMMREYREEIVTLRSLRDAGVIRPYRHRDVALREFASAIDAETSEVMIIGSSLKGLLQLDDYKEIAAKLRFKLERGGVAVKFLLTHPVVADLRAGQEARRSAEIGKEIIDSLRTLQEWKVPPEYVRLYRGTPTCFAIKTGTQMLLNPYPYGAVAYDSPCLIVKTTGDNPSYFYDAFDKSHFGAWDTKVAAKIYNYDETIRELQNKLDIYAKTVAEMFEK